MQAEWEKCTIKWFFCLYCLQSLKLCDMICGMKVEIVREKRKTLSLKVLNSKKAVLKAPHNISERKIAQFLQSKDNWLNKAAQKFENIEVFANSFAFDKFLYLNGQNFGATCQILLGFENQSAVKQKAQIRKFYLSKFFMLENLVKEISQKTGLKCLQVKQTNSVRIWGSFNTAGVMKLNWKLVILPESLVKYVIVHELCHGKFMNHSPRFWQEVEIFCPNYKKLKKQLCSYSFLLQKEAL